MRPEAKTLHPHAPHAHIPPTSERVKHTKKQRTGTDGEDGRTRHEGHAARGKDLDRAQIPRPRPDQRVEARGPQGRRLLLWWWWCCCCSWRCWCGAVAVAVAVAVRLRLLRQWGRAFRFDVRERWGCRLAVVAVAGCGCDKAWEALGQLDEEECLCGCVRVDDGGWA